MQAVLNCIRKAAEHKPACLQASSIVHDFHPTCMTSLSDITWNREPNKSASSNGFLARVSVIVTEVNPVADFPPQMLFSVVAKY